MVNKMKLYLIIFSLIIISSSSVIAVENSNAIGLQGIVELALEDNIDLQLAELNLEDARINYRKSQLNNLLANSRLIKLQAELERLQAEENYKDIKKNVILDIIAKYIDIISTSQQIVTAEKELELEGRRIEEVKAQVEVGYKSFLELFDQVIAHMAAENALEKLKDEMAQKLRELKQKVSISSDVKIELLRLNRPEIWSVTEQEALNTAIANNKTLDLRKQQVLLAESDLEKAKVSGTAELDLRKKEISLAKAKLGLTKEKQNIEIDVQNRFHIYKQSIKNMNMAEKTVSQAKKHYRVIGEQYKEGLVSKNGLLSSEISLFKARNNLIATFNNYYVAMLRLQKAMGLELGVEIYNEGSSK